MPSLGAGVLIKRNNGGPSLIDEYRIPRRILCNPLDDRSQISPGLPSERTSGKRPDRGTRILAAG